MRVLHIIDDFEVSGVSKLVVALANGLAVRGVEVEVMARPEGPLRTGLTTPVVELTKGLRSREPVTVWRNLQVIRESSRAFDIVHVHQRMSALMVNVAVLGRTDLDVVEHVHSFFEDHRLTSFRSPHLVAVGSAVASQLRQCYGRPERRVHVIPNGVAPPVPARLPAQMLPHDALQLLGIGRLTEAKDPRFFAEVVRGLTRAGADVKGTWLGNGELMGELCDVYPEVDWVGDVNDVSERLAGADALLMTSHLEGLPLSLLEALAAGVAVVSRDIGSCRDAVRDGETGRLFPANWTWQEWVRELRPLMQEEVMHRWGEAAAVLHEQHFTEDRMVDDVHSLYRSLMLRRR